jgi:eukaryotic-like serine/threonine-protein kinase
MPLEKGTLLNNRYRIEDTIAKGGMGAIYHATDETLGIAVAVKENFFSSDEASRQFRREATILASLRHPNMPRVTDHFVIPNQGQYLVMDFIDGSDLRELITRSGALPEEDIVRIGIVISGALAYLHSRNPAIVHRDIKPGNIKVTPTGQVFLVDFGLAKMGHGEATTTGAQGLTPGYAPPEQYGQGTEPRSDIYALGATLYAGLTGKVPEDGLSRAMGSAELTPIRKYNSKVSDRLARAIERAMAVSPDDRYASANDFKKALTNAAPKISEEAPLTMVQQKMLTRPAETIPDPVPSGMGESVSAATVPETDAMAGALHTEAPAKDRPAPDTGRKRGTTLPAPRPRGGFPTGVVLGIGSVLIVAIAAGILFGTGIIPLPGAQPAPTQAVIAAVTIIQTPAATRTSAPTEAAAPTATAEPTQAPTNTLAPSATTETLPTDTPTDSPTEAPEGDSGEIAFASDRGGTVQIYVMNADGSNVRQVTNRAQGACQPDWSPDGKRLVFISPCSGKQDEYKGSALLLAEYTPGGFFTNIQFLKSMPGGDFDPAWSPDGKQIAFTSLRDNGIPHIFVYNLADGTQTRLSSSPVSDRRPEWSPDGTQIAFDSNRVDNIRKICIVTLADKKVTNFSPAGGKLEYSAAWAPDNSIIVYSQGGSPILVARETNNPTAAEVPVNEKIAPADEARFSPDSQLLAFTYNNDVYIMRQNGLDPTPLTADNPGLDFHPVWRP